MTAQPYNVSVEKFDKMIDFAKQNGLTVSISIEDAWWYPGYTPLIVWRMQE